jgi:hypothetical protein
MSALVYAGEATGVPALKGRFRQERAKPHQKKVAKGRRGWTLVMDPSTGALQRRYPEKAAAALSKSAVRDFKPMPALTRSAAGHLKSSVWRFLFR